MGFFDSIGDFFQENIIDPVRKVAMPVIEGIGSAGKLLGPALSFIPGVGPALGGITSAIGFGSDIATNLGIMGGPSGPTQSPVATPGFVPWQSGGVAPTQPPNMYGAFQAAQAANTPSFYPMQAGGNTPGAGGYSPISGRAMAPFNVAPQIPYVDTTYNPWQEPAKTGCHCSLCCPTARSTYVTSRSARRLR